MSLSKPKRTTHWDNDKNKDVAATATSRPVKASAKPSTSTSTSSTGESAEEKKRKSEALKEQAAIETEIMKRRLEIDGPQGDDKKITSITKMFIQFCAKNNRSPEDLATDYNKLEHNLFSVELMMKRNAAAFRAAKDSQVHYQKKSTDIVDNIKVLEDEIESYRVSIKNDEIDKKRHCVTKTAENVIKGYPTVASTKKVVEEHVKRLDELIAKLDETSELTRRQMRSMQSVSACVDNLNDLLVEGKNINAK